MASDFFELYKHPRWQAMRLKIMKRDEFTCEECGSTEEMLTVHHSYYERGKKPWEYPEQNLHTLCENCHQKAQAISTLLKQQIGKITLADMHLILGYARGLEMQDCPNSVVTVESYECAIGIADAFNGRGDVTPITADQIIAAVDDKSMIDGWKLHKMQRQFSLTGNNM